MVRICTRRLPSAPSATTTDPDQPRDLVEGQIAPVAMAQRLSPKERDMLRVTSPAHFRPPPSGGGRRVLGRLESLCLIRRDGDGDVTVTDYGLAVRRVLERAT